MKNKIRININKDSIEKQKQRFTLLFLVSLFIFCTMLVSLALGIGIVYCLIKFNAITLNDGQPEPMVILIIMAGISLFFGIVLTAIFGKIILKPINRVIDLMNRMAAGDFNVKLEFGNPIGKHPVFIEISESFNKMANDLRAKEVLRSDFINNFSHEFKTPIVSIAGFAKLLKRGNLTEEQKQEYISVIEEESLRLASMATNVLNLTNIENQLMLTDISEFNLSEQIRSCVLLLESKWSKKDLELILEFDEYYIRANEELLKQVWINLIDNAIKFTPEKEKIEISITEAERIISISVTNCGSEIPDDKLEKIFDKFYQADESHTVNGNGIGLAIVKKVIDLHDGVVFAESQNNITTFTVELEESL